MKKSVILLVLAMGLVACDSDVQKAVRERLKDPGSAKFGQEQVMQSRACIPVDAKNSYGQYTGVTVAHLKRFSLGHWYVETLEGEPCNIVVLEDKLRFDQVKEEAESTLLEKLIAKGLVDAGIDDIYKIPDGHKCYELVQSYVASIHIENKTVNAAKKKSAQRNMKRLLGIVDSGSCRMPK